MLIRRLLFLFVVQLAVDFALTVVPAGAAAAPAASVVWDDEDESLPSHRAAAQRPDRAHRRLHPCAPAASPARVASRESPPSRRQPPHLVSRRT